MDRLLVRLSANHTSEIFTYFFSLILKCSCSYNLRNLRNLRIIHSKRQATMVPPVPIGESIRKMELSVLYIDFHNFT